jgi:hypothetical protein
MKYTANCHTFFLYAHVIYKPFTMLTLTAALHRTERPSWLAYKKCLETQPYSIIKNTYRWKEIPNSLSRRVGTEHVTATPKAKQNFSTNKGRTVLLLTTCRGAHSTPCYAAGPVDLARLAGRLPKFQVVFSKAEARVCPLNTKGKSKKTRNVHPLTLSLFLFSRSSGDSPGAESSRRNQFISA